MVNIEVNRSGTRALTKLVGVSERVFQNLHNRDNARRLVLNVLNWRTSLADVGKRESYTATALRKLQSIRLSATDRLHVVVGTQQVAGGRATRCGTTRVEEGWSGWLEAAFDNVLNHALSVVKVRRVRNSG